MVISFLVGVIIFIGGLVSFQAPISLAFDSNTNCDSEDLNVIGECLDGFNEALQQSLNATKPLESELSKLDSQIQSAQNGITAAKNKSVELASDIENREEDLAVQYHILAKRIAEEYKRSRTFSPIMTFLATQDAAEFTKDMAYRSSVKAQDNLLIESISQEITQLEADRVKLEEDQVRLAALEKQLDEQAEFFRVEIKGAKAYQAELSNKIAALSAKQQSIIAQKQGSLNLPSSLGAGALYCTDDRNLNPGFSPAFAFYTFGIPHRVGMSQYGAYGRAQAGQSYDQILRAYYNFDDYQDRGSVTIKVNDGNGINQGNVIWTGSLEDYIKRIYEIPASWPEHALKAQAIATRSYALAVTDNGNQSICANQHCQVFKTDPKGGDWEQAVNGTTGKVMVYGGQPITAWYASTAGGYTFTNADVWGGSQKSWTKRLRDTTGDVGNFGDLLSKAYDKDSPCMYAAQGWRSQYANSAWLKSEEVGDIANTILLARSDSSTGEHLYQPDKSHPYGGEVWDQQRVKDELRARNITPFDSVSSVSINADFGTGRSSSVTISGNAGSQNFSADEFRDWFNLRAPANIQIVGPLFNVEKK